MNDIDEVNEMFWKICVEFKPQTNIKNGYLEYIAALLYIIYYKEFNNEILKNLYEKRKNYYIADYIEPKRDKAPNLAIVRKLAFQDLDECMYKILADTLAYLEENPKDIDNATKDAFLYYRDLHMKRQS